MMRLPLPKPYTSHRTIMNILKPRFPLESWAIFYVRAVHRQSITLVVAKSELSRSMGLFVWITISIPYWNWYRFPADFTLAQGIDEIIGWFLGGMAIAWIVKTRESDAN